MHLQMWLVVGILGASEFWVRILGQGEFLQNGLPPNCGVPTGPKPPVGAYTGPKTESKEHSWPWHVGIYFAGFGAYPFCGGSLISPTWVLTAAHCLTMALQCKNVTLGQPFSYEQVTGHTMAVLIGAHNFTRKDSPAYNVRVKHAIIHPEFPLDGPKVGFDVALLKLDRDVKRSQYATFACLPKSGDKLTVGKICHVAGWGLLPNFQGQPSTEQPKALMEKPATSTDISSCETAYNAIDRRAHICFKQGPLTSCKGDSGGGIYCLEKDGRWTVHGLLSFTPPGCNGEYIVAASTGRALEWIKNTIASVN
ncbi:hypothetical protein AAHC03_05896 [Spirometra sp. Aus1]